MIGVAARLLGWWTAASVLIAPLCVALLKRAHVTGVAPAPEREAGSAMLIALIAVSALGLWLASVLGFAETGLKLTTADRDQRARVYAADGAVERAIDLVRQDVTKGNDGDTNCGPSSPLSLDGRTMWVRCVGQAGSGNLVLAGSSPALGIVTLSKTETGLTLSSNEELRVDGGVYSNSSIVFGGSNSLLNTCPPNFKATQAQCSADSQTAGHHGTTTALSACDRRKISAIVVNCPNGTADPAGGDPAFVPDQTTFGAASAVPPCPASAGVVDIWPGRYQDVAALNALTGGTCGRASLVWLHPGVYYFDFAAGAPAWTIGNKATVVAGDKCASAGSPCSSWGTANPIVPGLCNTADPHPGVELIFGGASHVVVNGGQLELCASATNPNAQQIAVFGVKTSVDSLTAESGCVTATPYVSNDSSGTTCALISTRGNTTGFVVHGTMYAPAAAFDLQLTNVTYQVVSRGLLSRVARFQLTSSNNFPPDASHIASPGLGSVRAGDREVLFTACEFASCDAGGTPRLRALVKFHDYDDHDAPSAGFSSTVESWSVVR